jgi:hypothetical protein
MHPGIRARFLQLTKQHSGTRGWSRRYGCTRQNDLELTKLAGLRIDFYRPAMLLNDDVVTDGEAEAGSFSRRLGGEERVE